MSIPNYRKSTSKYYNCNTDTLTNEGYYLKTFHDSIIEHMDESNDELQTNSEYQTRTELMKQAMQLARSMRKSYLNNESDYEDFAHDKELVGLKYNIIRAKVNFIQISIILVSTIITFLETVKEKFQLTTNISMTIAPIILSTYIGLALAISRFFKLDDHKEDLCKLDESMAFVMAGLRHRMREIERMKPLSIESNIETMITVGKSLDDQTKDGLEETISSCKQKLDLGMNLREKVKYKNILLKINLDKLIVDDNKKNLNNHKDKLKLQTYKKETCCLFKYLCCDYDCDCCRYAYLDHTKAYTEAEMLEKQTNNINTINSINNIESPPIQKYMNTNLNESIMSTKGYSKDYMDLSSHMCTKQRRQSRLFSPQQENNKLNVPKPLDTLIENYDENNENENDENDENENNENNENDDNKTNKTNNNTENNDDKTNNNTENIDDKTNTNTENNDDKTNNNINLVINDETGIDMTTHSTTSKD